jgi:hypothetical protein
VDDTIEDNTNVNDFFDFEQETVKTRPLESDRPSQKGSVSSQGKSSSKENSSKGHFTISVYQK